MKNSAMAIFFIVISTVYFLVTWYVFSRGMIALKGSSYRSIFIWTYWIVAATFIIGQVLERGEPSIIARVITHIGSTWLSVFLYLFLFVLIVDIVRLVDHFIPFFPERIIKNCTNGQFLFFTGLTFSLIITVYGYFNARSPNINTVNIEVNKSNAELSDLKVVLITDIHMGAMVGNSRVKEMVEIINSLEPDIVIFGGDLVDHNPRYMKTYNMGEYFSKIRSRFGVFAVTGNHEFIGDPEKSIGYMEQFGVKYLRDTMITIAGNIRIAGRDDKDKVRFTGVKRKGLDAVLSGARRDDIIILVDHQPVEYNIVQQAGIDLMLSGHTHRGQLWPFKYITSTVYPNDYGLQKNGNTYFYTSSGYGTWGPPVRTGNRSEVVVINIHFKGKR
jgi:uncharacterized protein